MAGNKRSRVVDARKASAKASKRLNVQMGEDAIQRLMIHCVMTGRNPGDILTELVEANLRQFRVQANTRGPVANDDRQDLAAQVMDSEAVAA